MRRKNNENIRALHFIMDSSLGAEVTQPFAFSGKCRLLVTIIKCSGSMQKDRLRNPPSLPLPFRMELTAHRMGKGNRSF